VRNIDLIREVTVAAAGRWPDVLSLVGITVPKSARHAAAMTVFDSMTTDAVATSATNAAPVTALIW